ncbi:hypothetical protein FHR97_003492 [Halomonas stenophila]|uniref:Uncharacterized protein n=1 Tax=Halomonas stenophila TaxID=795312 RepID=A0A7W5EWA6_9GAMM|nr:hypothetical protein [Halomonas stenophila]
MDHATHREQECERLADGLAASLDMATGEALVSHPGRPR